MRFKREGLGEGTADGRLLSEIVSHPARVSDAAVWRKYNNRVCCLFENGSCKPFGRGKLFGSAINRKIGQGDQSSRLLPQRDGACPNLYW